MRFPTSERASERKRGSGWAVDSTQVLDGDPHTVQNDASTSKKGRRHRHCNNCDEILGKLTVVCPRCGDQMLGSWQKIIIQTAAVIFFLALLLLLDLI